MSVLTEDLDYRVAFVDKDGRREWVEDLADSLTWEEAPDQIASRLTASFANRSVDGTRLARLLPNGERVMIYAGLREPRRVFSGRIFQNTTELAPEGSVHRITAYDDLHHLALSEDDRYYPAGKTPGEIIKDILDAWKVPRGRIEGPDVELAALMFRGKSLASMCAGALRSGRQQGGGHWLLRMNDGRAELVRRGSNRTVYRIAPASTLRLVTDRSIEDLVTVVKIVGREDVRSKKAARYKGGSGSLTLEDVAKVVLQAGFSRSRAVVMVAIAKAENAGLDPDAVNVNDNGSRDRGIFMINTIHRWCSDRCAFDPVCAARASYKISSQGSDFTPWVTFNNGVHQQYMDAARAAVDSVYLAGGDLGGAVKDARPSASKVLATLTSEFVDEYGRLQRIVVRNDFRSARGARKAAEHLMKTNGAPEETRTLTVPDVPWVRRGDWIALNVGGLEGRYLVEAVYHDALARTMTITVDEPGPEEVAFEFEDTGLSTWKPPDDRNKGGGDLQFPTRPGAKGGWQWPLQGPITGRYGDDRGDHIHQGVDISAALGTPVRAARAGKVKLSYYSSSYGNVVYVDHGGGVESRYAHLQSRAVSPGDEVGHRTRIGRVDNTGRSSGNHLHFEIRINGNAVDPEKFLP